MFLITVDFAKTKKRGKTSQKPTHHQTVTDLYLFQKQICFHKAVAEEPTRGSTVLEESCWVGADFRVGTNEFTIVRHQ